MAILDVNAVLKELKEQKKLFDEAVKEATGIDLDLTPYLDADGNVSMTETRIYVGLNDSETRKQKFETKKYIDILKDVCRHYKVAFSMNVEEGGYFHEDGEYTEEVSLVLAMIDADPDGVKEIARDLCTFFHQESVLVTQDNIKGYFVSGLEDELLGGPGE